MKSPLFNLSVPINWNSGFPPPPPLSLQIGRLRDYADDKPLCRKRLRRLIEREVALPDMLMEAHRIIASSLLRSGFDTDVEKSVRVSQRIWGRICMAVQSYGAWRGQVALCW